MFMPIALNSTAIMLSWAPPGDPNGIIESYHLSARVVSADSYIIDSGLESSVLVLSAVLRELVLTGLHPYVEYEFRLSASTVAGEGPQTTPQSARTDPAGTRSILYLLVDLRIYLQYT